MKVKDDQRTVAAKEKVIALFHRAYNTCVAYKHFIDERNLDPSEIVNSDDLEKIPITDKKNYIRKYSVSERLIDNRELADSYMITASSGSTGEPSFWPRDYRVDEFLETKKEALYEQHFQISKKRTLCINTFALGIWTAGMLTSRLSWGAAKHNKLTVISTGTHKQSILIAVTNLGAHYDQIIILGYPPFLLETIEFLSEHNLDLHALNIKIMYTSDSLSSKAREFLLAKISRTLDSNSIVGFYAASDTGIIAAQSPLTVRLSNTYLTDKHKYNELLPGIEKPVLFAFDPQVKYLETINNEVVITSDQPVPLIRYNIHDRGGVLSSSQLKSMLKNSDFIYQQNELDEWYVYILGKTDCVLLTANVYIEDIRYCLDHSTFFDKLSGNFKYGVEELNSLHKRLIVKIFLKTSHHLTVSERKLFKKEFTKNLFTINTDLQAVKSDAFQPIKFIFTKEIGQKYEGFKMKYFL
jgi:phenylacetate-CoA ligase